MKQPNSAFILVGGKGERLYPLTKEVPKPLLKIGDKPILEWVVERLASYNVNKIVLGVGHLSHKLENYFGSGEKWGVNIEYNLEDGPLGTGGALKHAEKFFDNTFIMLNGDNMIDLDYRKMFEQHKKNNAVATLALYSVDDVSQFGVAKLDGEKIVRFIEKPPKEEAPSNLINAGAYILEREIFDYVHSGFNLIEKTTFPRLAEAGKLFAYIHEGQWFPTDNIERLEKARKEWNPNTKN